MSDEPHKRRVRSFVRRPGRITAAQESALTRLMPVYGIPYTNERIDLDAAFGRRAPRVLDVGFGNGEALLTLAANNPGVDFLGVEVHEPGIGHLLMLLEKAGLTNVRIIDRDVVDVVASMIPDASFDTVNVFFPDPWPKKRHHKRRLVQGSFVGEIARILKQHGMFHLASDWPPYVEHAREALAAEPRLVETAPEAGQDGVVLERPLTKFERRGRRLGHEVADVYYRRVAEPGARRAGAT